MDVSLVKNRSKFKPNPKRDKHLEEYIHCLKSAAHTNESNVPVKNNICSQERNAIQSLIEDDSIIIKQADKGGTIVILDKEHYKKLVLEQLNNGHFYREIEECEVSKTMNKIKRFTKKFENHLTEKEMDYLVNFETKNSNFYGLPKIHKSKELKDGMEKINSSYIKLPQPGDLKLRPIVAGPSCPTQRLSNLIDIILKPLCDTIPSFIRDNMDFLNHLPKTVENNTTLVSFDVTSLYTNIPHNLGLEAISFWMDKQGHQIDQRFPKELILEGLQLILENNHFFFDDKYYLQIKGTAMGTKVAPKYATLVLGFLEEKMYAETHEILGDDFANYIKN